MSHTIDQYVQTAALPAQWKGPIANKLLIRDVKADKQLWMTPLQLHQSWDEYKAIPVKEFKDRIKTEVTRQKKLRYARYRRNQSIE